MLSLRTAIEALSLLDVPSLFEDYITGTCPDAGKEPGLGCTYKVDNRPSPEGIPPREGDRLRPDCWESCWKPVLLSKLTGVPAGFFVSKEFKEFSIADKALSKEMDRITEEALRGALSRLSPSEFLCRLLFAPLLRPSPERFGEVKPVENPGRTERVSMTMGPEGAIFAIPDDCNGDCDECDYNKAHLRVNTKG